MLSSASSKTAMGLAWLARKRGVKVTGLTSPAHVDLLKRVGLYDEVMTYDAIGGITADTPTAYVDFAGRRTVSAEIHSILGDALTGSTVVGLTHWDAPRGASPPMVGPTPVFFFAPDRIRQRMKDWGPDELGTRFRTALHDFIAGNPWLTLKHHVGPEALQAIYGEVVEGRAHPDEGHIVRPR